MELVGMEGRMFVIPYIACVCGGAAVLLRIMACMSERATVLPPGRIRSFPLPEARCPTSSSSEQTFDRSKGLCTEKSER